MTFLVRDVCNNKVLSFFPLLDCFSTFLLDYIITSKNIFFEDWRVPREKAVIVRSAGFHLHAVQLTQFTLRRVRRLASSVWWLSEFHLSSTNARQAMQRRNVLAISMSLRRRFDVSRSDRLCFWVAQVPECLYRRKSSSNELRHHCYRRIISSWSFNLYNVRYRLCATADESRTEKLRMNTNGDNCLSNSSSGDLRVRTSFHIPRRIITWLVFFQSF